MHPSDPMSKYSEEGSRPAGPGLSGAGEPRPAREPTSEGEPKPVRAPKEDYVRTVLLHPPRLQRHYPSPPRAATEKPPSSTPGCEPTRGYDLHRQYGVPDAVIDLLGLPPVLAHHLEEFYKLLTTYAQAAQARVITDWLIPWDQALARLELGQMARGKAVTVGLHYDRAAHEITRAGSLRFVKRDPFVRLGQDYDPKMVEHDEKPVDYAVVKAELRRLDIRPECVWDLAYVMAAPMLEPVQANEAAKRNHLRQLGEDVERRRERTERRRAAAGNDHAVDADFEQVAGEGEPPSPPALHDPGDIHVTPEASANASPGIAQNAAPQGADIPGDPVDVGQLGVPAQAKLDEAATMVVEEEVDGNLF